MRLRWLIAITGLLALTLSACNVAPAGPVTLAKDKPTFLFFYADG